MTALKAAEGGNPAALYKAAAGGRLDEAQLLSEAAAAVGVLPLKPLSEVPPPPPPRPPPPLERSSSSALPPGNGLSSPCSAKAAASAARSEQQADSSAGRPQQPGSSYAAKLPLPLLSPPPAPLTSPQLAAARTPAQLPPPAPVAAAPSPPGLGRKRSLEEIMRDLDPARAAQQQQQQQQSPRPSPPRLDRPPLPPLHRSKSASVAAAGGLRQPRLGRSGSTPALAPVANARAPCPSPPAAVRVHSPSPPGVPRAPSPSPSAEQAVLRLPVQPHVEAAVAAKQLAERCPLKDGLEATPAAFVRLQAATSSFLHWRMHFLRCPIGCTVGCVAQASGV